MATRAGSAWRPITAAASIYTQETLMSTKVAAETIVHFQSELIYFVQCKDLCACVCVGGWGEEEEEEGRRRGGRFCSMAFLAFFLLVNELPNN